MKRTTKFLAALIIVLTLMMSILPLTAIAADEYTLYLAPNSNWKVDNARFAVYVWIEGGEYEWFDMTDPDGDGIYEANIPSKYSSVIFCRMDPSHETNKWDYKWNQTNDLTYNGTDNLYTMADDAWDNGDGAWYYCACFHDYGTDNICTKCGNERFYIIAGNVVKDGEVYKEGDNTTLFGTGWDVKDENNKMVYDPESGCYIKLYENVAKGEYAFKVAVDKSWDISYGDYDNGDKNNNFILVVEEDGSTVLITLKDGKVTFACSGPKAPTQSENTENPDASTDGTDDEPEVKLNFFQRIWRAIVNFCSKLFGKNK